MQQKRLWVHLITGVLLVVFFAAALYLRITLPYDKIFSGEWTKFAGTDTYYFMRLVDNILHNYPHAVKFDPYLLYPGGAGIITPPFFQFLISTVILAAGLGSPSPELVDKIGVYFPAVLGALCIIPVYFIGKTLFNRWAGIIGTGLLAISPGEFLGRSILGFTDQHVAEVFLSTTAILFIILAFKLKPSGDIKLENIPFSCLKIFSRTIIYSLLAGLFLGLYLATWYGALLFVLIIFIFMLVQLVMNHLRKQPLIHVCIINSCMFIPALIIFLITSTNPLILAPLLIAIVLPPVLAVISFAFNRYNLKLVLFPISIILLGAVSVVLFYLISPDLFKTLFANLNIFTWPRGTTILEMQPILFPSNRFSVKPIWFNYTTGLIMFLVALGLLIYQVLRKNEEGKTLIIIWTLVMLAATLSMRRFAYYLAVNVALLSGYVSWLIIEFLALRKPQKRRGQIITRKEKRRAAIASKEMGKMSPGLLTIGIIAVFFISFFPNIGIARSTASAAAFAPEDAWCESLTWLKENTTDPFGDPDYYYQRYDKSGVVQPYEYPESAYSIAAWWDYGYWITRIGHRIPISNPGTNHNGEAFYFANRNVAEANAFLEQKNSRYIIIDSEIVNVQRKFYALAQLSGSKLEDYIGVFYTQDQGKLQPVIYYFPEYYQTMAVRLYYFDAAATIPQEFSVISYVQKESPDGQLYRLITGSQPFNDFDAAVKFVGEQKSGEQYKIVSSSPLNSPVPLESLPGYKLVYSSHNMIKFANGMTFPEIKIFEFTPGS